MPQTPSRLHLNPPSRPPSTAPAGTPRLKLKPPAAPVSAAPQRKPLEQATPPKEKRRSKKGRYTEEHPAYFSRDAILAMAGRSSPPPSLPYGLFTSQTEPDEELSLGEYLARPVAPIVPPHLARQAKEALRLSLDSPPHSYQQSDGGFRGISEGSDLGESQGDFGTDFRRMEEEEEEEDEERREEVRIEQDKHISAAVSQNGSQKKKASNISKPRGKNRSETAAPSSSLTRGAVDGLPKLGLSQNTNNESRIESPFETFNFNVHTRAFWEKNVNTCLIHAGEEMHSFSGDNDLNITKHHQEIGEKANIYAIKRMQPSYQVSVLATPSYGKLAKSKQHAVLAQDSTQWGSILLTLQRWHEEGFGDLKVELLYHFARTATGEVPPVSKAGQPTSKPVITKSSTLPSSHIPTTNQLLQREAAHTAEPGEAEYEALLAKWVCDSHVCPNKGFYCFVDRVDGKHLKLDALTAKLWNHLISSDPSKRLSINEPPNQIRQRLQKTYNDDQKKKKKEASNGLPFSGMPPPTWAASTGPLAYSPYQLPYQLGPYPLPPLPIASSSTAHLSSIRTSTLQAELANRGVDSSERRSRSRSSSTMRRSISATSYIPQAEQRSSPVEANLDEYIKWMKKKNQTFAADFEQAYKILLDQGYTTDIIQPWKTEEKWKELGIKPGIGLQLAGNISKWGRERAMSQPHHQDFPKPSEQGRFGVSPHIDARPGKKGHFQGRVLPSIEHDDGEPIRADSASDGEDFAGDIDLDDVGWQDDSQATQ